MSDVALATANLSVHFGAFRAVDDVTLSVAAGARHALIGPNGAGKTTLVHALTGHLSPTTGRVLLGGDDITTLSEAGRARRGLVRTFQITQLFRGLTVLENVVLAILERDGRAGAFWCAAAREKAAIAEAMHFLDFVQLTAEADRAVHGLPYGSQRLIEIAIALALRPRVLVLDEPAAGVPAAQSGVIFERIHALPQDMTVLFIEHDMGLVFRFSDRVTVLVGGKVLVEGTPAEISAHQRVKEVYLGQRAHHVA